MSALKIIKNIYVNPRLAFAQKSLDETINQALVAYFVLVVVTPAFVLPRIMIQPLAMQQFWQKYPWIMQHLALCYFGLFLVGMAILFLKAWLVQYLAEKRGARLAFKSLLSGQCWIVLATLIPSWLLYLISSRTSWIITAWNLVLMAFCIQSLTGFSLKRSAGVLILAHLISLGLMSGLMFLPMMLVIMQVVRLH